jgi:hypothetical protein
MRWRGFNGGCTSDVGLPGRSKTGLFDQLEPWRPTFVRWTYGRNSVSRQPRSPSRIPNPTESRRHRDRQPQSAAVLFAARQATIDALPLTLTQLMAERDSPVGNYLRPRFRLPHVLSAAWQFRVSRFAFDLNKRFSKSVLFKGAYMESPDGRLHSRFN